MIRSHHWLRVKPISILQPVNSPFGDVIAETEFVIATYAAGHAAPQAGEILITTWDGGLEYASGEEPQQLNGDKLVASYLVDRSDCVQVTLEYEVVSETYIVPDGRLLTSEINGPAQPWLRRKPMTATAIINPKATSALTSVPVATRPAPMVPMPAMMNIRSVSKL